MFLPAFLLACTTVPHHVGSAPAIEGTTQGVVRLAVVGDTGKGNPLQQRVAQGMAGWCAEHGCDAVLVAGDLIYPRGMESADDPRAETWVAEPYRDIAPVYLTLGNHDYGHGRSLEKAGWLVDWAGRAEGVHLPSHQFEAGLPDGGRLFVLDTNLAFQFDEQPQQQWLQQALPQVEGWRVVLGHHPFRSDGPHGNAGAYEGWRGLPWLSGRALETMFDATLCPHADLYLAGHDHNLQLLDHCGVALVVSGSGAAVTEVVDRGNDPAWAAAVGGFVWVELRADGTGRAIAVSDDGAPMFERPLRRRLRASP
jgi:predicted phosphodiesterase